MGGSLRKLIDSGKSTGSVALASSSTTHPTVVLNCMQGQVEQLDVCGDDYCRARESCGFDAPWPEDATKDALGQVIERRLGKQSLNYLLSELSYQQMLQTSHEHDILR